MRHSLQQQVKSARLSLISKACSRQCCKGRWQRQAEHECSQTERCSGQVWLTQKACACLERGDLVAGQVERLQAARQAGQGGDVGQLVVAGVQGGQAGEGCEVWQLRCSGRSGSGPGLAGASVVAVISGPHLLDLIVTQAQALQGCAQAGKRSESDPAAVPVCAAAAHLKPSA